MTTQDYQDELSLVIAVLSAFLCQNAIHAETQRVIWAAIGVLEKAHGADNLKPSLKT